MFFVQSLLGEVCGCGNRIRGDGGTRRCGRETQRGSFVAFAASWDSSRGRSRHFAWQKASHQINVERPTKFELIIYRKTETAIGLTIPNMLLVLADEMIE
jgi:hypothetical protein